MWMYGSARRELNDFFGVEQSGVAGASTKKGEVESGGGSVANESCSDSVKSPA